MDAAFSRICSEQFRLQVHELDLIIAVLVNHNFALEVFRQI